MNDKMEGARAKKKKKKRKKKQLREHFCIDAREIFEFDRALVFFPFFSQGSVWHIFSIHIQVVFEAEKQSEPYCFLRIHANALSLGFDLCVHSVCPRPTCVLEWDTDCLICYQPPRRCAGEACEAVIGGYRLHKSFRLYWGAFVSFIQRVTPPVLHIKVSYRSYLGSTATYVKKVE